MPLFVTIFYTREATHDIRNEQSTALEKNVQIGSISSWRETSAFLRRRPNVPPKIFPVFCLAKLPRFGLWGA